MTPNHTIDVEGSARIRSTVPGCSENRAFAEENARLLIENCNLRDELAGQHDAAGGGWISVDEHLPNDETPVIILLDGIPTIGELRWENPSWEETYEAFRYWDNPGNDGQDWCWSSITHWMPLPTAPEVSASPVPGNNMEGGNHGQG